MKADPVERDLHNYEREQVALDQQEEAFQSRVNDERYRLLFSHAGMEEVLPELDPIALAPELAELCVAVTCKQPAVIEAVAEKLMAKLDAEALKLAEYAANNPGRPSIPAVVPAFLQRQAD